MSIQDLKKKANQTIKGQQDEIDSWRTQLLKYVEVAETLSKKVLEQEQEILTYNAKVESYEDLERRLNAKILEQDEQISAQQAKVTKYEIEFNGDAVQAINSRDAKIKSVKNLYRNLLNNYSETTDRCAALEKEINLQKPNPSRQRELQDELEKTNKSLDRAMEENDKLSSRQEALQNELEKTKKALDLATEQTINLLEGNASLSKKNKKLDKKNINLKSKNKTLSEFNEISRDNGDNACFSMTFDNVTKLAQIMMLVIDERGKTENQIKMLRDELTQRKNVCDNLQDEIRSLKNGVKEREEFHLEEVRFLVRKFNKSGNQKENYIKSLKQELITLKDNKSVVELPNITNEDERFASLQKELAIVKNQRNRLIRESKKFRAKSTTLEKENESIKTKLNSAQRIII